MRYAYDVYAEAQTEPDLTTDFYCDSYEVARADVWAEVEHLLSKGHTNVRAVISSEECDADGVPLVEETLTPELLDLEPTS